MHRRKRRHSKTSWLNAVAICLMAAGVVMAFTGRQVLRWVPPPIPAASAAAGAGHGRGHPARTSARPVHLAGLLPHWRTRAPGRPG